jgi:DNA-directed RNA polymerase specialized sigma24 family protein
LSLLGSPAGLRLSAIETRWSIVPYQPSATVAERDERWRQFLATYDDAMIAYVRAILRSYPASRGASPSAEDVVQDFLAVCLEKDWLGRAAPGVTRKFRALLQTMLRLWTYGCVKSSLRIRRRPPPGRQEVLLDEALAEMADPAKTPEEAVFDGEWARATVARAVALLKREKSAYAGVIEGALAINAVGPREPRPGITPVKWSRAQTAFREAFFLVLRETVDSVDDLPEEWRHLAAFLP